MTDETGRRTSGVDPELPGVHPEPPGAHPEEPAAALVITTGTQDTEATGARGRTVTEGAIDGPAVDGPAALGRTSARHTRRRSRADVGGEPGDPAAASPAPSDRPVTLRMAGLHLRMGQHPLARAELEACAGRGTLDEPALLDLAEVRWRTGDLAGAGEAANALLARGREEPLALVIAAEAVAALGRPGEARRLAGRALAQVAGPLDPVFAGLPRSSLWPDDPAPVPGEQASAEMVTTHPGASGHAGRSHITAGLIDPGSPASNAAAEAFAGGRAALASGDVVTAGRRLGVALRLDPRFADDVLDALGAWDRDPGLALVAGDALRLLGREAEALFAFEVAGGRS